MGMLRYSAIASLDGYIEDERGEFGWAEPDEQVHAFVNDRERGVGTYLYGRRLYETMRWWESMDDPEPLMQDYAAVWQAAEKVVYSRTLDAPLTARTRIERDFDPVAVRALVDASPTEVGIGGATLAGAAIAAGLVDAVSLFLVPVVVGGGKGAMPVDALTHLELVDVHRFDGGTVFLDYRVRR